MVRIEGGVGSVGQTATPESSAPSPQIPSQEGEATTPAQAAPRSAGESPLDPNAGLPVSPDESGSGPSTAEQDIVVTGRRRSASDPLESVNIVSFKLTQKVDDAITAPAARLYVRVTPKPVRVGFRHFLNNLREPVVFANFLLQHKFGKAAETVGRFAINSTLGVAGVVDVAHRCPFNLPWRPNGFSDTLGVYGVKPGPFMFIPLVGPTTVRDFAGGFIDRLASPFALGGVFRSRSYLITTNAYRLLDRRAEQEDELRTVRESADPYVARRELYLRKRRERIDGLRGSPPRPDVGAAEPAPAAVMEPRPCRKARPVGSVEEGRSQTGPGGPANVASTPQSVP